MNDGECAHSVDRKVESATLIVTRNSERDLKMRGIEVFLDGRFIADLQFGGEVSLDLEPGTHVLKVTNKLKSRSAEFEVQPGDTIRYETVGLLLGGVWLFVSMLGTIAYGVTLERAS